MALRPRRNNGWVGKENASPQEVSKPAVKPEEDRAARRQPDRAEDALRAVNPSELRRRLVDTRAAFRTLQIAHKKMQHKVKVDKVIHDAIERNENEFLKKQVAQKDEEMAMMRQESASKDKLIQNLKKRIAAHSRCRSYSGRNMSQVGSMMDMSNLDLSMDIRDTSPPPGARGHSVETATQVTPVVGSAPSSPCHPLISRDHLIAAGPEKILSFDRRLEDVERDVEIARRIQRESQDRDSAPREDRPQRAWTVDVSPMSCSVVSGEGGLSVEGGLDQVNQRILCMLSTGANALQQPSPEAPDLDETTLDDESLRCVSRLEDRSDTVPQAWLIEQLQMVRDDFKEREKAASDYCQLDSARSTTADHRHQRELVALREHAESVTRDNEVLARERDQLAKLVHDEAERVRHSEPRQSCHSGPSSSRTLLPLGSCTVTPRDDTSCARPTPRVLPPSGGPSGSTTPSGFSAMIARGTSSGALLSPPMPFGSSGPGGQHAQHNGQRYVKVGEHKTEHWRIVYDR